MNAKKIMGAVLVALLAAALFIGAGAAAEETAVGSVYLYQVQAAYPAGLAAGTYTCGDAAVTVGTSVVPTDLSKFVNGGKYSNGTNYIVVKLPNAEITAVGGNTETYDAMANGLISGQNVTFTGSGMPTGASVEYFILYHPDGNPTQYQPTGTNNLTIDGDDALTAKGTYQIQAVLNLGSANFDTAIMPGSLVYGQKYTFTVYSAEPGLSLSADTVIKENFITATVTGVPGHVINLTAQGFKISKENQIAGASVLSSFNNDQVNVTIPNTGNAVVYLQAKGDAGKYTILAKDTNTSKTIKTAVKIVKGAITVDNVDTIFVGNTLVLSGTTTAGSSLYFYIEGTNYPFTQIDNQTAAIVEPLSVENGKWTIEFNTGAIKSLAEQKKLVAGTYTVVVSTFNNNSVNNVSQDKLKETVMGVTYGTAAVSLTQPFLTGIEANAVAIQDTDYFVTGTAYSAANVYLYVFGTNFFAAQIVSTDDDETFEFKIPKGTTKKMAPGTYFYLIQHPMNDGKFNVWEGASAVNAQNNDLFAVTPANKANEFYYAASGAGTATFIFDAYTRGTNYAAQALLEAISGQDIDDIFVQGTFEVEAQKLTINPIPAEVAQGSALAVSGTTNSGEGVEVIVNVLAGTFGATIKGDENAAVFLTQKAITNEDGTWEAAIDTSKLEVGNYIVTVELNGQMYDSAAVEIVEAAAPENPEQPEEPEQPEQPEQPEAPATPGFGALAALAGLGAVAVLLLRRE